MDEELKDDLVRSYIKDDLFPRIKSLEERIKSLENKVEALERENKKQRSAPPKGGYQVVAEDQRKKRENDRRKSIDNTLKDMGQEFGFFHNDWRTRDAKRLKYHKEWEEYQKLTKIKEELTRKFESEEE